MTLFGIDVSHHQRGIDLREVKTDFAFAKLSEGQTFRDPMFVTYSQQARQTDLLFAGYHYLRGDSPPHEQAINVANALQAAGAPDVPVIIDLERTSGLPQPTIVHAQAFLDAASDLGVRVPRLLYLPEWYWSEIGRPDVRGWSLWQSDYGQNNGIYPGDDSSRWGAAGQKAAMLQFTSNGSVPGYSGRLDVNAYPGTRESLAQRGWFSDYKEQEVATKVEIQTWVATTPIVVDAEGTTEPLQKVLRRLLSKDMVDEEAFARALIDALPEEDNLTRSDVRRVISNVLRNHGVI